MCTLIIGRDVLGPHSVVLAANRDEDPARASDPPMVLNEDPWVVGGRDRVAGGTWLAIRDGEAAVALLNRYEPGVPPPAGPLRSRGLLTLDVATSKGTSSNQPIHRAAASTVGVLYGEGPYAPHTLV